MSNIWWLPLYLLEYSFLGNFYGCVPTGPSIYWAAFRLKSASKVLTLGWLLQEASLYLAFVARWGYFGPLYLLFRMYVLEITVIYIFLNMFQNEMNRKRSTLAWDFSSSYQLVWIEQGIVKTIVFFVIYIPLGRFFLTSCPVATARIERKSFWGKGNHLSDITSVPIGIFPLYYCSIGKSKCWISHHLLLQWSPKKNRGYSLQWKHRPQ